MSLGGDSARRSAPSVGDVFVDDEEGGPNALPREQVEQRRRGRGIRAIVEREKTVGGSRGGMRHTDRDGCSQSRMNGRARCAPARQRRRARGLRQSRASANALVGDCLWSTVTKATSSVDSDAIRPSADLVRTISCRHRLPTGMIIRPPTAKN